MAKIILTIISVLFGSYPQDTDGTVQPIEWEVLKREGDKALLCSKNILTTRRSDSKSNVWKNSEIRRWLKNNFMNTAFTDEEKAAILKTKLPDVGTTNTLPSQAIFAKEIPFLLTAQDTQAFSRDSPRLKIDLPRL